MIKKILVVCIGNICRSPMGEALLKRDLPHLQVTSAGLSAMVGHGADATSIMIMDEQGVDIRVHRARMTTETQARENDLILVMDVRQKFQFEQQYPFARGKVFLLCDSQKQEIPDPYRQSEAVFRASFELINKGCDEWVKRIRTTQIDKG